MNTVEQKHIPLEDLVLHLMRAQLAVGKHRTDHHLVVHGVGQVDGLGVQHALPEIGVANTGLCRYIDLVLGEEGQLHGYRFPGSGCI